MLTGLVQLLILVNHTTGLSELIGIDIEIRCRSRTRRLVVSVDNMQRALCIYFDNLGTEGSRRNEREVESWNLGGYRVGYTGKGQLDTRCKLYGWISTVTLSIYLHVVAPKVSESRLEKKTYVSSEFT